MVFFFYAPFAVTTSWRNPILIVFIFTRLVIFFHPHISINAGHVASPHNRKKCATPEKLNTIFHHITMMELAYRDVTASLCDIWSLPPLSPVDFFFCLAEVTFIRESGSQIRPIGWELHPATDRAAKRTSWFDHDKPPCLGNKKAPESGHKKTAFQRITCLGAYFPPSYLMITCRSDMFKKSSPYSPNKSLPGSLLSPSYGISSGRVHTFWLAEPCRSFYRS